MNILSIVFGLDDYLGFPLRLLTKELAHKDRDELRKLWTVCEQKYPNDIEAQLKCKKENEKVGFASYIDTFAGVIVLVVLVVGIVFTVKYFKHKK